jgi:hypothetical protein
MNNKIASVVLATALSLGTIGTISNATADPGHAIGVPSQVSAILAGLVTSGTITQAQSDAITTALTEAAATAPRPTMGSGRNFSGAIGARDAAVQSIITATLGITAADLVAARTAGTSLATLAGEKKTALISAIVNYQITQIDAAVTAGSLTTVQADTRKAGLLAKVTAQIESVPGQMGGSKFGGMGMGKRGHGHNNGDDDDARGPIAPTTAFKNSGTRPSIM